MFCKFGQQRFAQKNHFPRKSFNESYFVVSESANYLILIIDEFFFTFFMIEHFSWQAKITVQVHPQHMDNVTRRPNSSKISQFLYSEFIASPEHRAFSSIIKIPLVIKFSI